MTHTSRIRAIGAVLAVGVLTGCSLVGADEPAPQGEQAVQAQERVDAIRDTGRPPTHDLLASMGSAPKELFTLPVAEMDPRGECRESACVVTWRPLSTDTVVAEGTVGSNSREGRHAFRTALDLTTGTTAWSNSAPVPPGQADAGEICLGGSAESLVCVETGPGQYAFRTISAENGEQVARAPFVEAPAPEESSIVGMSAERRGDAYHVSVLVQEDDARTRTASVHAAQIAADGSIVWHHQSPASIGNGILSETYRLGDQIVITHVTSQDGEPFALSAETGDRVTMSADNADALTGLSESVHSFVDDGSAADYRFLLDAGRTKMLPAGDVDEEPLWTVPAGTALSSVCGGAVALTEDESAHAVSMRALDDGSELWQRPLSGDAAISCDGEHLLVADEDGLTALDPETGEQAWSVDGQWDGVRVIKALDPSGTAERFAVISAGAAGEETVTVYQAR
ncbi:PQQ-binding-like beta-propeller repeat protein [Janibacter alittae]|uniref:PQQ-binding-like beta-propeller repeat protein n=1 Tax=Janibacter alittae TaxID=3115209 RepID=A0ABZ2MHP8_9MICO